MRNQRKHRQNGRLRSVPRPSVTTRVAPRLLGSAVIALAIAWSLLVLYAAHIELPANALDLPFESSIKPPLQALVPEGWGFFTRDPREARLLPYVREAGSWRAAREGPNGEPRNAFGFNRAARAQGVEMGLLETSIPTKAWKACATEIAACLDRISAPIEVGNPTPAPTLCGDVGLVHRDPLPWAWAGSEPDETSMPSKVVRLTVKC